jgi:uncharacterized protein (DUF2252 family)
VPRITFFPKTGHRPEIAHAHLDKAPTGKCPPGVEAAKHTQDTAAAFEASPGKASALAPSLPAQLTGKRRKAHLVQSLLADHVGVRAANPAGWEAKLAKITDNPFSFFRGTAGLFYRDLEGVDADAARVVINGDVHPENFGIMQAADGELVFGLNDFDEATVVPFKWDVRRAVVGFELAARELDFGKKDRRRVTEAFVEGYADALRDFQKDDGEATARLTEKGANRVVDRVFDAAKDNSRAAFLKERVDVDAGRFLTTDEIQPCRERLPELTRAVLGARDEDRRRLFGRGKRPVIKDVAEKLGSGTGSVGLDRFYVLIEGPKADGTDDHILELKRAKQSIVDSALNRRPHELRGFAPGHRIAAAHDIQLAAGDPTYGFTTIDGESFLVRERNPHKARVDLSKLSDKELQSYAKACGAALALAHARSDADSGLGVDGSAEDRIRNSFKKGHLVDEMAAFADDMADRVEQDFKAVRKLMQDGEL